jgi:urea transport system permease protein/urea transport system ATP-binding protein
MRLLLRPLLSPRAVFFAGGVLLIAIAPFFLSFHYQELLLLGFIFGVFAISFDLLWGYTGVLSLGHSAFFGIGAYGLGICVNELGPGAKGVTIGILSGIAGAVVLAVVVGGVAFYSRVPPIYIAVITLSSALVLQRLAALTDFTALSQYTGGYNGMTFAVNFWTVDDWYTLTACGLVIMTILGLLIARSDFGRVLVGIRDNEQRMAYLGYNVPRLKLTVFAGSAVIASIAGMGYGAYLQRMDSGILGLAIAIDVLIVVSVGGRGTIIGPVLAAVLIGGQSSPSGLLGPTISERWLEYWQLILGLVFIGVVLLLPRGFYPAVRDSLVWARRQLARRLRVERLPQVSQLVPATRRDGRLPKGEVLGRAQSLEKSFGALRVLRGVDLELRAGEILCIVGPNGAGKSTLINIITDTREASGGKIVLRGSERSRSHPAKIVRLGVGRTFQGSNLMETYTVADSLFIAHRRGAVPSIWRRTTRIPASSAVLALDEATGLTDVLDARVADLSHGKRQALELSMALSLEPELLLLDEPTAGLTHEERVVVGGVLKDLAGRGLGIVLIEHDLDFVRTITDRVAVLHQGKVGVEGPIEEVVGSALVREIYLGVKG